MPESEYPMVFVVEDDEDISKLIRLHLSAAGFDVRCFRTASGVIVGAERRPPWLFLLDITLPGVDGLHLCRAIRKHDRLKAVPIIVVTARVGESDRTEAFNSGADDFVLKPFNRKDLILRVNALCRHPPG